MMDLGFITDPFMIHAWISGLSAAVLCSCVGFFVVLRGNAFAAHALPEAGFAGGAGAVLLGINPLWGLSLFAILGAIFIGISDKKERGDVTTALALMTALGLGALFLGISDRYAAGAYSLLFGQIVGVSEKQAAITVVMCLVCLAVLAMIARPLMLMSVSAEIARSQGVPVKLLETVFLILVGVCSAITVPIVGALLCFSLLIGPAAAGALISHRPGRALAATAIISVASVAISLILAYYSQWPAGFFVSALTTLSYVLSRLKYRFSNRSGKRSGQRTLHASVKAK